MNDRRKLELDRLVLQYLDALDRQDWEAYGEIWRLAETDRELELALHELHEGLLEEHAGEVGLSRDAKEVATIAMQCFPARPDPNEELDRPLTVGDVAARLRADLTAGAIALHAADREANERLLENATPLPEQLKASVLASWRQLLEIDASREYWRLFRQAAMRLTMSRSFQQGRLAAARQQNPRQKPDEK